MCSLVVASSVCNCLFVSGLCLFVCDVSFLVACLSMCLSLFFLGGGGGGGVFFFKS